MKPYSLSDATAPSIILMIAILCSAIVLFGCNKSPDAQREDAHKAMISLMNSYIEAIKELNVDKTIAHYLQSPEFMFYSDGKRESYDELVAQVRELFPSLKKFEGKWDTIHVSVLNSDAVAAVAPFHEIFTDKNGVESRIKGEVTWIAVRRGDQWKFLYAHAFHQPDTTR